MNRMAVLDELLADADELLDEADAQTITDCLARGEAPDHRDAEPCPWCRHQFHGLGCYPPREYLWISGDPFGPDPIDDASMPLTEVGHPEWCRCESALTPLDDTWRPFVAPTETAWLMHVTGLDGYSARALFDKTIDKLMAAGGSPCPSDCRACAAATQLPPPGVLILSPGVVMLAPRREWP
jgi:hypothetical protein